MDNLFAYLGNLGSRDALLNRNKILDDFLERMECVSVTECSNSQEDVTPSINKGKADCLEIAEDAIKLLKHKFTCTLSLPCEDMADKKAQAFAELEDFTRELFLKHHNENERSELLRKIGLSASGMLERHETGQLRDRLFKILKDPVSDYSPEKRTAPAKLRDMINGNMAALFSGSHDLEKEVKPFINDYYLDKHIRRELETLREKFNKYLGAPADILPEFLKTIRSLIDNFAYTAEEKEAGRSKLDSFTEAFASHNGDFPSENEVSAYKENRMLSMLQDDFNTSVQEIFTDELKFLMIASYEYTNSLYRLKIRNGHNTEQAEYITAFDMGKKHDIKKHLQYSARKLIESGQEHFMEGFRLGSAILSNQQTSKTVLPHFIRRIYDTGVSEGKTSEREAVAHSLFDIGPILALISVSTTRKNPYLMPIGDTGKEGAASVGSFVNAFSCVPMDKHSAGSVLAKCKKEMEKEKVPKRKNESVDFLHTVTPEKLTVFGQFMTERLTHACFLNKAYQLSNSTPYRSFLKQQEDELHKKSVLALQNRMQDYFDFYLDKLIERMMLLPMPLTRLRILAFLEAFLTRNAGNAPQGASHGLSPAGVFRYLEILTEKISGLVTYWTDSVIPCHILYYHYMVSKTPKTNATLTTGDQDYFADKYSHYLFFENNSGTIDIAPSFCESLKLQQLQDMEDKGGFDLYAARFYNYFLEETYRITLSQNFYQMFVRSRFGS